LREARKHPGTFPYPSQRKFPTAGGIFKALDFGLQASGFRILKAVPARPGRARDCGQVVNYVYTLQNSYTSKSTAGHAMRTNIEIEDKLMRDALNATGLKTKRAAVELGLQTLIRLKQQEKIRNYRGKLEWTGNLDDMRSNA